LKTRCNELRRQYDTAIKDHANRLADELIELAWTPPPKDLDGRAMSAWVQHLRVRIQVLQWTNSKLKPSRWGDRVEMSATDNRISITEALSKAEARLHELPRGKVRTLSMWLANRFNPLVCVFRQLNLIWVY